MALKIGIFSLKNNVGCTAIAIHIANYLAGSKSTVALIEPETVIEPEYNTVKADFNENGTFVLNNVRYYPLDATVESDEDIQIYDFGVVNYMFKFPSDINKLYICVSNDEKDINDVIDFINETGNEFEVIIIGGTKNLLQLYNEHNLRAILVSDKKEPRIDRMLADKINFVLRRHFIIPPEYHNDWEYAPTIFHYVPEDDEPKKGFLGSLFGNKKKIQQVEDDVEEAIVEDIEEIIDINNTGVGVVEKNEIQKANEYTGDFDFDFSNIPAPIIIETEINDEVSESLDNIINEEPIEEIDETKIIDKKMQLNIEKEVAKKEKELKQQQEIEARKMARAEKEAKKQELLAKRELEKQEKMEIAAKRKAEIDAARLKAKEEREAKRKEKIE